MPTVDGFSVPASIEAQWRRELETADDAVLLAFAKNHPRLVKGARLTSSGVSLIRKRLVLQASAKGEMREAVRDLIATCGLNLALVAVLSEEALELGFDPLAAIYGHDRFAAAMLVDHREVVREHAIEILKETEPPPVMAVSEALRVAKTLFGKFIDTVGEWTRAYADASGDQDGGASKSEPTMPPHGQAGELRELKEQLADARQKRAGEKTLQKKIDKMQTRIDALELSRDDLLAEREQKHAEILDIRQQLRAAEKQNQALHEDIAHRVSVRVGEELDSVKRAWFRDARQLDARWRECRDGVDDVLVAAEIALARQAEADRHSGNLREIRGRLDKLLAARDTLLQAGKEALTPLPELVIATERVTREIYRLNQILPGANSARSPLLREFEMRIVEARSADELECLAGLLEELIAQKLLSTADGRAACATLNRATGKLYDRFMPKVVAGPFGASTDPVCLLRAALAGQAPTILLLDGHNVLFELADLFEDGFDTQGFPGAVARAALLQRLRPFVAPPSRCEVRLYFDGPTRSDISHAPNLTEIYSGGGHADQRADRIMIEYLAYCTRNRSAMPRILVTNDRALASEARAQGAQSVSATRFGALLEDLST